MVWPNSLLQQNYKKTLSFRSRLLPLLDMFAITLNCMLEIILNLRIKYDDSINEKQILMRTVSIYHDTNLNYILQ